MKKIFIFFSLMVLLCPCVLMAQQDAGKESYLRLSHKDVEKRARDHFLIEFGYMRWTPTPSSSWMPGFHRQVNLYGMYDFLIKAWPYMSIGLGLGAAFDNVYFKKSLLDIDSRNALGRANMSVTDKNFYEKSKLTTIFGEVPLELRFTSYPQNYNKGFKAAIGMRLGYLLSAYTKQNTLKDSASNTLSVAKDIKKDSEFLNQFRALCVLRIGWGPTHIFATYSLLPLFNPHKGPDVRTWSIGIGLNGL